MSRHGPLECSAYGIGARPSFDELPDTERPVAPPVERCASIPEAIGGPARAILTELFTRAIPVDLAARRDWQAVREMRRYARTIGIGDEALDTLVHLAGDVALDAALDLEREKDRERERESDDDPAEGAEIARAIDDEGDL